MKAINRITFRKILVKVPPKDTRGRRTIGFTFGFTHWVLLLDGKRISKTYISNSSSGYQCRYKNEPLSRLIKKNLSNKWIFDIFDCRDDSMIIINDYKTLKEAKLALVDYFNQHFEENPFYK